MKLCDLVECNEQTEITSLSFDSNSCVTGSAYFCLVGGTFDGHDFCEQAVQNGAVAIIACKKIENEFTVPIIVVDDTRHALAVASSRFFGDPSQKLKLVGITGTNGKTTTSYIVKSILSESGYRVGLIGTNGIFYGNTSIAPTLTTPDPIELNRALKNMVDDGVEYAVMEVSAHALKLNKIDGLNFEVVAFTNLSEDHLDFFGDMEEYRRAKAQLFLPYYSKNAVINVDDAFGRALSKACPLNLVTYGCDNPADVFAIDIKMSIDGLEFVINLCDEVEEIKFCMSGRFNVYNVLCAAATCKVLAVPLDKIKKGVQNLKKVDGRFNIINTTKYGIIIDFAHTEDGLFNILKAINEFKKGRVITVFGCGGNREKEKRAPMARVATSMSDFTVITSDNPRYESPDSIIDEIEKGVKNRNYMRITDRREAIKFALEYADKNDIVLIAGKGAEEYQEINGIRYEYNDEAYVKQLIEDKGI